VSKYVLKIPKKLTRLEILSGGEISSKGTSYIKNSIITDGNDVISKAVFSQEFSFSGSNEPVEVLLKDLPTHFIPIDVADKQKKDSYEKGFTEGEEYAVNVYKNEIESYQHWIRNIENVIRELRAQVSFELSLLEESLPELAVLISEKIIEKEISENSRMVIEQVQRAIGALDNEIIFKIHLNPSDIEILESVKSTLVDDSSRIQDVQLVPNDSVEQGFCILETSVGKVDARRSSQVEIIKDVLTKALQKDKPGRDIELLKRMEEESESVNDNG
jgi:flagellar biosynthesis/type III secretory pathway protein FliH